ncbi:MAG: cytochrome P450 [Myxococcales bacterium]
MEATHASPPSPPLPVALQTLLWIKRPTEFFHWCGHRYGAAFTLKLPMFPLVMLSDPADIRALFAARPDEMHAGRFNTILRTVVGDSSVLLLDGEPHLSRRKLLLPSFHGERMRFYGATMADITRRVMSQWPRGESFSLHPQTQEITLQIILRTVFGMDEGADAHALHGQIKRMLSQGEHALAFLPLIVLAQRPQDEQRAPWRWMLRERDRADGLLYQQIKRRREDHQVRARKDVLAMLLDAKDEEGQGLSDRELRDELMTALAAGHETTATSLAWAFERILSHPRVYQRLRDEVRALGKEPDPERLAALPYLDACLKEVLRLRPVVPVVGRVLKRPFRFAGYDLPEGTRVAANIYLAQRNPELYPEPDLFRPERFLGVTPDPGAFLPFGGGVRRCIGAAFAQYEMKIVLGTMLAQADFTLAQQAPARTVRRTITFWPEHGTQVIASRN